MFNSTWSGGHLGVFAVLEGKAEIRASSRSTLKSWERTSQTRAARAEKKEVECHLDAFANQSRRSSDSDAQPFQSFLIT